VRKEYTQNKYGAFPFDLWLCCSISISISDIFIFHVVPAVIRLGNLPIAQNSNGQWSSRSNAKHSLSFRFDQIQQGWVLPTNSCKVLRKKRNQIKQLFPCASMCSNYIWSKFPLDKECKLCVILRFKLFLFLAIVRLMECYGIFCLLIFFKF
jgi:hypothetical protein